MIELYGPHLMLECYGCNCRKLSSLKWVHGLLDRLPEEIGMHRIGMPFVFNWDSKKKPEDWGISGIVFIAESHIALHTYPSKAFAAFDIFSCKDFNVDRVASKVIKRLEAKSFERHDQNRGRHFPQDAIRTGQMMVMQRKMLAR